MAYRGVLGAIPYAVRASDSWFFRLYAVVGTLFAAAIGAVVAMALIVWMAETAGIEGGTFAFSRSLFVVVGFAAVAPLLAPTLLVARRHRRGDPVHPLYDQALAAAGSLFLAALYLGLLASVPPEQREPVSGALAPAVEALYALPGASGIAFPVLAAALLVATHRRLRGPEAAPEPDEGTASEPGPEPGPGSDREPDPDGNPNPDRDRDQDRDRNPSQNRARNRNPEG
jgi:hypothetical protein